MTDSRRFESPDGFSSSYGRWERKSRTRAAVHRQSARLIVALILVGVIGSVTMVAPAVASAATVTSTGDIPGACAPIMPPVTSVNTLGDQVAVWPCDSTSGGYPEVNVAYLPAGATWSTPSVVGVTNAAGAIRVGIDGSGKATIAWMADGTEASHIMVATIDAAGPSSASMLSDPGLTSEFPELAVNGAGDVVVGWSQWNGTHSSATGDAPAVSVKAVGGEFGSAQVLAPYQRRLEYTVPVALDDQGNAAVAWTFSSGPLQMSSRPAGGSFGGVVNVSGVGGAGQQQIFMPTPGTINLGWLVLQNGGMQVQSSTCSLSGACSTPTTISGNYSQIIGIDFAFDAAGEAVASWGASAPGTFLMQAAVAAPGAAWGTPIDLGDMGMSGHDTSTSLDGQGNAFVSWTYTNTDSTTSDYGAQISISPTPPAPLLATRASLSGSSTVPVGHGARISIASATPSRPTAHTSSLALATAISKPLIGRLNAGGTGTRTASAGTGTIAGVWAGPSTSGVTVHSAQNLEKLAPSIVSNSALTLTVGTTTSHRVETTGFPTPSISASGAVPPGVTFTDLGDGTATLSGTPTAVGIYSIFVAASNGVGAGTSQALTVSVQESSPAITSAAAATFGVGQVGSFTVTTRHDYPELTTVGDGGARLPGGVTFVDNGDGTAILSGKPAPGSGGAYVFTITASNGVTPNATQLFTLTVAQPPAFTSANNATVKHKKPFSFQVTTTGYPAATISETGTLPLGVSVNPGTNGTAVLSGTPPKPGKFTFTLTASNGVAPEALQTFTLTVR